MYRFAHLSTPDACDCGRCDACLGPVLEDAAGNNPAPITLSPFARRAQASELPVADITGHRAPLV